MRVYKFSDLGTLYIIYVMAQNVICIEPLLKSAKHFNQIFIVYESDVCRPKNIATNEKSAHFQHLTNALDENNTSFNKLLPTSILAFA